MYEIGILDDENGSIEILKDYISKVLKNKEEYIIREYTLSSKFLNEYQKGYDVVFLDICMPGMNGMEVAKKIREVDYNTEIVFITSIEKYAIQGYEVNAIDYILKPYDFLDFEVRFNRILKRLDAKKEKENKITIKTKDGYTILNKKDIVYIESEGHYLLYHTVDNVYRQREALKDAMENFCGSDFASCNKGYIVNLKYVKKIDDVFVYLGRDEKIQIARLKKKSFIKALAEYYLRG